jgi:hypothetical protein
MAVIELVLEPVSAKQAVVAEATAAAKRDADKKEASAAAPAAEEAPEAEVVETEAAEARPLRRLLRLPPLRSRTRTKRSNSLIPLRIDLGL